MELLMDFDAAGRRRPQRRESAPLSRLRDEEFPFETEWRVQAEESFARAAESWYIVRPGPDPAAGTTLVTPQLLKVLTADDQALNGNSRLIAL